MTIRARRGACAKTKSSCVTRWGWKPTKGRRRIAAPHPRWLATAAAPDHTLADGWPPQRFGDPPRWVPPGHATGFAPAWPAHDASDLGFAVGTDTPGRTR